MLVELPPFRLSIITILLGRRTIKLIVSMMSQYTTQGFLFSTAIPPIVSMCVSVRLSEFILATGPAFRDNGHVNNKEKRSSSFTPSIIVGSVNIVNGNSVRLTNWGWASKEVEGDMDSVSVLVHSLNSN